MRNLKLFEQFIIERSLKEVIFNFLNYGILPFSKGEKDMNKKKYYVVYIINSIFDDELYNLYDIIIKNNLIIIKSDSIEIKIDKKNNSISLSDNKLFFSKDEINEIFLRVNKYLPTNVDELEEYSDLTQQEIKQEIDKSLDNKDYDKVKILSNYLR